MIVLGLHFGHDSGVAVLRDGEILSCVIRERQVRVKHAMALDVKTICKALKDAEVRNAEIDLCAITSTQGVELLFENPNEVSVCLGPDAGTKTVPCAMDISKAPSLNRKALSSLFSKDPSTVSESHARNLYAKYLPEYMNFRDKEKELSGWIDEYIYDDLWRPPKSLKALTATRLPAGVRNESLRYGFHYPASVLFQGHLVPAFFINHHACHAASSYYQSGFRAAAILSQDGGSGMGYDSGMFYYGEENRLYPIAPHHSISGVLYDLVAFYMNLGESSAGKLMGLSAYGKPVFYDSKFLGNRNDFINVTKEIDAVHIAEHWMHHCLSLAKDMGYDLEPFGDAATMTAPINIDIAASTQKLFEETTLALAEALHNNLKCNGVMVDSLCLSGGAALNCPSNSRIYSEGRFRNVFVEPGCDDSGLAIGAALNCYYNLLDQPLLQRTKGGFSSPSLGPRVAEAEILLAIDSFKEQIIFEKTGDWARDAAHELKENRVIGWLCGRSEIGPRALGHRSILADARDRTNWERVNNIKKRELWRPFAPAVLESESEKWFSGIQLPSPYMLFNATVKSMDIPAVTHVDGSARVQTVNESDGAFYDVLTEFFRLTGVPILLNTSFNGPGEPIVETPLDAVKFFVESELDVLYLESYKIARSVATKAKGAKEILREKQKVVVSDAQKFMADIKEARDRRQRVFCLVEADYKGFNIVVWRGGFIGLRHGIAGESQLMDLEALKTTYGEENVIVCESVEAVRAKIDRTKPVAFTSPRLILSEGGYNIVAYGGKHFGIPHSLGSLEVDKTDFSTVSKVIVEDELSSVIARVRKANVEARWDYEKEPSNVPRLVFSEADYNIVVYDSKYFGIPQCLGPLEVDRTDFSSMPNVIVEETLEAVLVRIRKSVGRQLVS